MSPAERVDRTVRALGDPHRRALLDTLRHTDGLAVRELEAVAGDLGRHAVLKHIRVLEAAELVTTRKSGRTRRVYLNATPIVDLARRWLTEYGAIAGLALSGLREYVENDRTKEAVMDGQVKDSTRTIVSSVVIEASAARVWQALTDPAQTVRWFFGGQVRSDWNVGSSIEWVSVDGASLIAGEITAIEPEVSLAHTFSATWSDETASDPVSNYEWVLEPMGDDLTRVSITHSNVPVGTPTEQQVDGGSTLVVSSLKTYVETGRTMPGMG